MREMKDSGMIRLKYVVDIFGRIGFRGYTEQDLVDENEGAITLSPSNIQNMKLNAGDLMFEEGNNNGRYRNIYHVEMIKGYTCYGFDANGQPLLGIAWANRPDDYY